MLNVINQHMKHVEHALSTANARAAFAFALACTERQWPVFQRASAGRSWVSQGTSRLRQGLDAAWSHVIDGIGVSHGLSAECTSEVPQAEDITDGASAAAHTIANSVIDLLDAMKKADAHYAHHLSGRNLGLLEILLEDLRGDELGEKRIRELIDKEIQRQKEDLGNLLSDSSSSGLDRVRQSSVGRSLFGELWFPQEQVS